MSRIFFSLFLSLFFYACSSEKNATTYPSPAERSDYSSQIKAYMSPEQVRNIVGFTGSVEVINPQIKCEYFWSENINDIAVLYKKNRAIAWTSQESGVFGRSMCDNLYLKNRLIK